MPFTCAFCKVEIQAGDLIQPDIQMNLAHRSCVEKELKAIEGMTQPVTPSPPPAPPPLPISEDLCFVTRLDCSPPPSKLCVECGKPCGPMCPYCEKRVHNGYGWNGETCSLLHERICEGAREARNSTARPDPPPNVELQPYYSVPRNGQSAKKSKRKRGRR